jgi:polyisoprenoid-binding protein YceI
MTIRHALCTATLFLAFAGNGMAETYTLDSKHTFPSFEISHIGFSTQRGRFDHTSGKIKLDAKNEMGSIHVNIDADSIDTGLPELEAKLRDGDFFNTAKFPTINFDSNKIKFTGEKPIAAEGTLTFLGISKPVLLAIEHFHCGVHPISQRTVCGADATGLIKRSDFGMTAFLPMVGDEVKLSIQVEAFLD